MRIILFIVLVVYCTACNPGEKTADNGDTTTVDTTRLATDEVSTTEPSGEILEIDASDIPPDDPNSSFLVKEVDGADTLYNILARKGLASTYEPYAFEVHVVTRELFDVGDPQRKTHLLAAVIVASATNTVEDKPEHTVTVAVFNPAQNMKLVAYTFADVPDSFLTVDNEGAVTESGNGPSITTSTTQLVTGGSDVVVINDKHGTQYIQGSDEDENVQWFSLVNGKLRLIMMYSSKYNHLETGDEGYEKRTVGSTQLEFDEKLTSGVREVILKSRIETLSSGEDDRETNETERYKFSGNGYILSNN